MNFFQSLAAVLTPTGLLWTVIILGIAVTLHELAHYALARWQGVPVKSFSVGMGPVLWRRNWKGTEWRISALPLGGYVEIDGMAPVQGADGQMHAPTTGYAALPNLGKIAVILAGPVMNLILALGLMTFYGATTPVASPTTIYVLSNSKASEIGLKSGDIITGVDGNTIDKTRIGEDRIEGGWNAVLSALKVSGNHTFNVSRNGESLSIPFEWQSEIKGKREKLGISLKEFRIFEAERIPSAFIKSMQTTVNVVPQVIQSFANLFKRFLTLDMSQDQGVSGPIGTAEIVSRAAALGPWALVQIAIMLNLSLAFFNLIPIPGLDGGRILLTLIGAIKGSPLTFTQENAINFAGFAFVMLLMMFVILRDASRFF